MTTAIKKTTKKKPTAVITAVTIDRKLFKKLINRAIDAIDAEFVDEHPWNGTHQMTYGIAVAVEHIPALAPFVDVANDLYLEAADVARQYGCGCCP